MTRYSRPMLCAVASTCPSGSRRTIQLQVPFAHLV